MKTVLPIWVRITWLCLAPLALLFAARIAWEKTFLTWAQEPQMVGFSMVHLHPLFFLSGLLCSYCSILWLILAAIFLIKARKRPLWLDMAMIGLFLFVFLALAVPDFAFASSHK